MKFFCTAFLLISGLLVWRQEQETFIIITKDHQRIPFSYYSIWSDTTFTTRCNPRYFYFQNYFKNNAFDSIATNLIASVVCENPDQKQREFMNALFKELAMDCDKQNVGDFIIHNASGDSIQLTLRHIERKRRKYSLVPKRKECLWNFPVGEYPYVITYKNSGKVYKRGVLKVECCKPTILTIE